MIRIHWVGFGRPWFELKRVVGLVRGLIRVRRLLYIGPFAVEWGSR